MQENLYDWLFLLKIDYILEVLHYTRRDLMKNYPLAASIFSSKLLKIFIYLRHKIGIKELVRILHMPKYFVDEITLKTQTQGYCNICGSHYSKINNHITAQHNLNELDTKKFIHKFSEIKLYMPKEYRDFQGTFPYKDHKLKAQIKPKYIRKSKHPIIEESLYDNLILFGMNSFTFKDEYTKEKI